MNLTQQAFVTIQPAPSASGGSEMVQELGGEIVTIGSDAHNAAFIGYETYKGLWNASMQDLIMLQLFRR